MPSRRTLPPVLFALILAGCATMRTDAEKPVSTALAPATDTPSARYIQSELARRARGESGFRLLTQNANALLSRLVLADHAEHSIDLQYYIFKNDATGRVVAQHLLSAADRGVRIRLLLDDANLEGQRSMLDAMDAHENIEVRLFNPFQTREPSTPSFIVQILLEGSRLNRRMHNKSFIVDNRIAVIGGRNIGDDYFDAGVESNFRDLDLIAIGPVVGEASRSFDDYWNCDAAVPVTAFDTARDTRADLDMLRTELGRDKRKFLDSDYAQAAFGEIPGGPTADRRGEWFWGDAFLVADDPAKAESGKQRKGLRVAPTLDSMLGSAERELLLISPYFIPGKDSIAQLVDLERRGVSVRVLTNSLASTDEAVVHAKYAPRRRALLAGGVELYELRPLAGAGGSRGEPGQSSGVSLHAKAFSVDGHITFVGSLNLDPRSALVNTEMGIFVNDEELAAAIAAFFKSATQPRSAYALELVRTPGATGTSGRIVWHTTEDGVGKQVGHEPDTSASQRFRMRLLRLLPIEGLL